MLFHNASNGGKANPGTRGSIALDPVERLKDLLQGVSWDTGTGVLDINSAERPVLAR
jgi:hypothetical protein